MKVCIAEKPSVAKEIAQIIGAKSRKDGFFEGNGYAVTWTFGHFCELYNPDDYNDKWKRWSLDTLPMLPDKFEIKLKKDKGVKKQFKVIKNLLKKAQLVINCGDAGQEGELIQRWVLQEAKYRGNVDRLWISSLTSEAIRDGFKALKPATDFDRLYYAGSARAISDWLLGMNATRLYTLKYGGYKQVLSIGRVQTPTLAMVVARDLEIRNFVSKPFWELHTEYKKTNFTYEKGRFNNQEEGQKLIQKIEDHPFTILSVERKLGKEYAYRLFDLTSLQVHCNKRFSYTAEQTLKYVQKLYEMKVVTYPRVDTTYLPTDMYPKISGILQKMTAYSEFTSPLLKQKIRKTKRVFDDKKVTDHHAIIPTGNQAQVDGPLNKVYDAIARQFIAAFYPDCEVANTTVVGESNEVKFKAKGKEILKPGWKVLFPKKQRDENEDEKDKVLPTFEEGESAPHSPKLVEKKTNPPKHYTEATLLRAMETAGKIIEKEDLRDLMKANGIGRPSTRANIIETLFKRKYIMRQRKNILATDTGIQLIQTIQNELVKSPELTGIWEKQLREIEAGTYSPKKFINDMKVMVDELVTAVRLEKSNLKISAKPISKKSRSSKSRSPRKSKGDLLEPLTCPKCSKGNLLKGKQAFGCSRWKEDCSFKLPFKFKGKKISPSQVKRLVVKGCTTSLKGFIHQDEKVEGLIRFDAQYNLVLEPKKHPNDKPQSSEPKCPKCKSGNIIRGRTAYGCDRWKSGCDFRYGFDLLRKKAGGKTLTKELALKIMTNDA